MADHPLNYHLLTERVATSGQPTEAEIHAIADDGYTAVVNLATHDSENALVNEGSLVASLGLLYFNIPVPFEEPEARHLKLFAGLMDALADERVWVHCAVNARVSAFMYQYLILFRGVDGESATTPLLAKWRRRMDPVWAEFLELTREDVEASGQEG